MNTIPLSILIPVYNRTEELIRCISSIANQSVVPSEIIVYDDGSDIEIKSCIDNIQDLNILYVRNSLNNGVSFARNQLLSLAKNNYVLFIDSDDEFNLFDSIETFFKTIIENDDITFAVSYNLIYDIRKNKLLRKSIRPKIPFTELTVNNFIKEIYGYFPMIINKKKLNNVRFDEYLKIKLEDNDFVFNIFVNGGKGIRINKPLGKYNMGSPYSLTIKKGKYIKKLYNNYLTEKYKDLNQSEEIRKTANIIINR